MQGKITDVLSLVIWLWPLSWRVDTPPVNYEHIGGKWAKEGAGHRKGVREKCSRTWQLGVIFSTGKKETDERQVLVVKGSSDGFSGASPCDVSLTDR